jgi:hypothetical protein
VEAGGSNPLTPTIKKGKRQRSPSIQMKSAKGEINFTAGRQKPAFVRLDVKLICEQREPFLLY